jgi:predicted TIM-barrel fold metal-dependent hydrolase
MPPLPLYESTPDRRRFLAMAAMGSAGSLLPAWAAADEPQTKQPLVVDTHMHVWADDPRHYPFGHPYDKGFRGPPHKASLEMLIEDMDQHGCTHAVLVQVIYHGWDNRYVADCLRRYPERLRAHGLIDPTDPQVADKLRYWVQEHGLHGMRFSPIYYQDGKHGGDGWLDAPQTHRLWRVAEELKAVFNFFIAPTQLPRLAKLVQAHEGVPVILDHLSQMDLGVEDPEPQIRALLAMAQYPNVWVKVSELSSVSKSKRYPFTDAFPVVKRVYEAFGPDRLLFGTGYPGAARAAYNRPSLAQEIELIRSIPCFTPEDRRKILGANAARLWSFKPA